MRGPTLSTAGRDLVIVTTTETPPDLRDELVRAAIWGTTLVQFHEYLKISEDSRVERNRFYYDCNLATPAHQTSGANVETLYGFAWVDLSAGPQVLEVPDTDDRYYCLQFFDSFFQTVAYVGRRTTGPAAATFLLAGPQRTEDATPTPAGMTRLDFGTNLVYVMPRMQVRDAHDPTDVAEAARLLDGLVLGALSNYPGGRSAPVGEADATGNRFPVIDLAGMGGAEYFDRLCRALSAQPAPRDDATELERFRAVGIGPDRRPSADPAVAPLLDDALNSALEQIRAVSPMGVLGEGPWLTSTPIRDTGPLDPKLRARMNIDAPGFQVAAEATYAALVTASDGSPLTGEKSYLLHFDADAIPPVDAFWSMTMYSMPGMRLVDNPIDRYAIGSNFTDLAYGEDGSLDLIVQRNRPTAAQVNWLPAPPADLMILCRFYQPGIELIEGRYSMPAAVAVAPR